MHPINGIGRPFSGNERKETTIRLRMDSSEVAELDECAKELHTTRSGVIREGIKLVKEKLSKSKK